MKVWRVKFQDHEGAEKFFASEEAAIEWVEDYNSLPGTRGFEPKIRGPIDVMGEYPEPSSRLGHEYEPETGDWYLSKYEGMGNTAHFHMNREEAKKFATDYFLTTGENADEEIQTILRESIDRLDREVYALKRLVTKEV